VKKLWYKLGFVTFWLGWPGLWLYLRGSKRTRALIICGNEFLAIKTWLGTDTYKLPGGGRHKNENATQGVIRETFEETGINLAEKDLTYLYNGTSISKGLRYNYDAFAVTVRQKPPVHIQKGEVISYAWLPLTTPPKQLADDVQDILGYWQSRH
jgi:8-oxo-dGTP pyrophosphatase MutT (NUDIX family)